MADAAGQHVLTLGDVPAISVESSRVDITRHHHHHHHQLPHLPSPFNPAVMAAQLGMFSNPQLLNMMNFNLNFKF
ncbi:hypothetical protein RB195_000448 [Necator americanus]|uniref:Uncharacterized protein n=1 Tax=Necator americanus TaxID=51031 RepID=A0ABR1DBH7_NECAM